VNKDDVDTLSIKMAAKTQDYTGAEISLVCREAVMIALEGNL
jgi:SpoVK/Ycf46/Vps4 family AAA+-type ATPase